MRSYTAGEAVLHTESLSALSLARKGVIAATAGACLVLSWLFVPPTGPEWWNLYGYTLEVSVASGVVYVLPFYAIAGVLGIATGVTMAVIGTRRRKRAEQQLDALAEKLDALGTET